MYQGKRISIVIPCHNEEEGIAAVLDKMPDIVDEVVVVDNCSTDNTAKVALERLRALRIVAESTGRRRDRLYTYAQQLGILNRGTA